MGSASNVNEIVGIDSRGLYLSWIEIEKLPRRIERQVGLVEPHSQKKGFVGFSAPCANPADKHSMQTISFIDFSFLDSCSSYVRCLFLDR